MSILLFLLSLVAAVLAQGGILRPISPGEVDRLLSDEEFVQRQLACVLGTAPCDQTGRQLRVAIPEVLVRQCRSCSPNQAENARKVINHIQTNYPEEWAQIQARYGRRRAP